MTREVKFVIPEFFYQEPRGGGRKWILAKGLPACRPPASGTAGMAWEEKGRINQERGHDEKKNVSFINAFFNFFLLANADGMRSDHGCERASPTPK